MGPVGELVQEIAPLYMSPAGPRSCRPDREQLSGVTCWSQGLLLIEGRGASVRVFVQPQTF